MKLREHQIVLSGERVVLRPMTEQDWDMLLRWNSDPEVLYFAEGSDVTAYDLADVQGIYRVTSQTAFCFIAEVDGTPMGEGWLQAMNEARILRKYPDQACRRIDLMIGEKVLWGHGYGTDIIRTLTRFGFEQARADRIYGCGIWDYKVRSLGAFQKVGYQIETKTECPPGQKGRYEYDLVLTRAADQRDRAAQGHYTANGHKLSFFRIHEEHEGHEISL
jgi:RimJ/RimL family protein N-acetyltransferase